MFRLERILAPIDFSAQSTAAAQLAALYTSSFGGELTLLHVVESRDRAPSGLDYGRAAPSSSVHLEQERARKRLDECLKEKNKNFRIDRVVRVGDAATEICAFAKANGSDLIVLPTHGYGVFRRLLLGSTTAKVLHDAGCPVVTGTHLEDSVGMNLAAPRRMLCAVDLDEQAEAVLGWAALFSQQMKADLVILHVVCGAEGLGKGFIDPNLTGVTRHDG